MNLVTDGLTILRRNLIQLKRVPDLILFTLFQPIMFIVLFGYVFGAAIGGGDGANYRSFLIAGIFAQTILFGSTITGSSGMLAFTPPAMASFCSTTASRSRAAMSVSSRSGSGIRAKRLNSSTIRRRSLVWRTITSAYCSRASRWSPTSGPNLRHIRSAESWIGVSGFLIS